MSKEWESSRNLPKAQPQRVIVGGMDCQNISISPVFPTRAQNESGIWSDGYGMARCNRTTRSSARDQLLVTMTTTKMKYQAKRAALVRFAN